MSHSPALESTTRHEGDVGAPAVGRDAAHALGTWMAILGGARLLGEAIAYVMGLREALPAGGASPWNWARAMFEAPPVHVLIYAWPLILGLALRRARRGELLKAAALTFFILAIGSVTAAIADWSGHSIRWIAIGSFRVPKAAGYPPSGWWLAIAVAGLVQVALELTAAGFALAMALRAPEQAPIADGRAAVGPSTFGKLAIYLSAAFLLLSIRLPATSAYVELLAQSRWVRDYLLRDDVARMHRDRRMRPTRSAWSAEAQELVDEAQRSWRAGRYENASESYTRLITLLDGVPTADMSTWERGNAAEAYNDYAWLLATCPDTSLRNYEDAVKYARRSLELLPDKGMTWNTLGVAYFRLESWDEALNALYRSMELRDEGDSADWFFLAMIHHRLGHEDRAHEWYEKADRWTRGMSPENRDELYRFEIEAAEALGLPRPDPLPPMRRFDYRRPGTSVTPPRGGNWPDRRGSGRRPPGRPGRFSPRSDGPRGGVVSHR